SSGQSMPMTRDFLHEEEEKIHDKFDQEVEQLTDRYVDASKNVGTARQDTKYQSAMATVASYQKSWDEMRRTLFPALAALFVMATLVLLLVAMTREAVRRAVPYYLASALSGAAVVFLAVNIVDRDDAPTSGRGGNREMATLDKAAPKAPPAMM